MIASCDTPATVAVVDVSQTVMGVALLVGSRMAGPRWSLVVIDSGFVGLEDPQTLG
jgi:hypothetical protein